MNGEQEYKGASSTTKTLLKWWFDTEHENFRYYFAQREAVETIIYLHEIANIRDKDQLFNNYNSSLEVTQNILQLLRLVTKMATGSGKQSNVTADSLSYFSRVYKNKNELIQIFNNCTKHYCFDRLKTDFDNFKYLEKILAYQTMVLINKTGN